MKDIGKTLFLREIGNRIRAEREYLGLTREKFAEIVDLSSFYIGQIERGDRTMSLDTLLKIADSLKLSIDYIVRGKSYDIKDFISMDAIEDSYGSSISPEIQELIEILTRIPKDKVSLIRDIIKLILPHIK